MFHICEGGKKISFLCPNGTIFQQTDLICDWWFKVNCAASPGHYAESSEILSRAQHRYKTHSSHVDRDSPTATANPFGNHGITSRNVQEKQSAKNAFDFQPEASNESYEENIAVVGRHPLPNNRGSSRRSKAVNRDTSKETQETAASSSFVGSQNDFNGYHYREPTNNKFTLASEKRTSSALTSSVSTEETTSSTTRAPSTTTKSTSTRTNGGNSNNDATFTGYHYLPPERTSRRLETTRAPLPVTILPANDGTTTVQPLTDTTTLRNGNGQRTTGSGFTVKSTEPLARATRPPPLIRNTPPPALINRIRPDTSRTTPFYTPTIPTIITSRYTAAPTVTLNADENLPTPSPLSVSEHAIEMMKTLQELKLDTTVEPTQSSDGEYEKLRPGLVIPPSSGPDALNALAIFYATANDNLALNKTTDSTKLPGLEDLDVQIGNVSRLSSTLVSNSTAQKYETLFGIDSSKEMRDEAISDINSSLTAPSSGNDLETEFSSNPILAAAGSPQIRELAQVFTHALSAYLHDPLTFRRVLSEIRPTEPSAQKSTEFLTNRIGRTDEFNKGTGPTYLPTASTLSVTATTSGTPTTEDLEVLEFSDVTASTNNKETTPSTTDPSTRDSTTTIAPDTTTIISSTTRSGLSTTHTKILKQSLTHIDHVPASRILTEALENKANGRVGGTNREGSTESSNPLAMEINGGLVATTNFPYLQDEDDNSNSTGYFPIKDRNQQDENNKRLHKPYGHGVKPANSTPIYDHSSHESSTDSSEDITSTTTDYPAASLSFDLLPPATINKGFTLPLNDILPPVDDNDLQRAQSQSIYGNGNDISLRGAKTAKLIDSASAQKATSKPAEATTVRPVNGHYITQTIPPSTIAPEKLTRTTLPDSGKFSTSPWSTLAYTVFLDPLTINDGLMQVNDGTITPSPHTYLPKSTQTPSLVEVSQSATESLRDLADADRRGKAATSTISPTSPDYMEVMQRKANEMFGGLNETSADHLMNVMKKADKNKTVRRLILLLIQTCDDDYNTTVEQSRTALLNALIGMDGKVDEENEVQIIKSQRANGPRSAKSIAAPSLQNTISDAPTTSSTSIPITTYHRPIQDVLNRSGASSITSQYVPTTVATTTAAITEPDDSSYKSTIFDSSETETTTNYPTTVTDSPTTYRTAFTTYSPNTGSRRSPASSVGRVSKDLDRYLGQVNPAELEIDPNHKHSDTRALELLRSLYSLAGRFGK